MRDLGGNYPPHYNRQTACCCTHSARLDGMVQVGIQAMGLIGTVLAIESILFATFM